MSYYQLRGVTGFNPRRNDMAEVREKAAYLPAMKQAEFARAADNRANDIAEKGIDQNQAYYTKMAGLTDDANKAAEKDRQRGLLMQGGLAVASGYDSLNDAVGGNLMGKTVGAVKDVFTPASAVGRGTGSAAKEAFSAYGGGGSGFGIGDVAGLGKDYIVDPLVGAGKSVVEGVKKVGSWAGEAATGLAGFLFG